VTCKLLNIIFKAEFDAYQTQFQALSVAVDAHRLYYLICQIQFPIGVLYLSDAWLAHLRLLPLKCKTPHFSIPYWSSSLLEFRITGFSGLGRLWQACIQDTDVSCQVAIYAFCCTM